MNEQQTCSSTAPHDGDVVVVRVVGLSGVFCCLTVDVRTEEELHVAVGLPFFDFEGQILLVHKRFHTRNSGPVYQILKVPSVWEIPSVQLRRRMFVIKQLPLHKSLRMALNFRHVQNAVSHLLFDELPNALIHRKTKSGSLNNRHDKKTFDRRIVNILDALCSGIVTQQLQHLLSKARDVPILTLGAAVMPYQLL